MAIPDEDLGPRWLRDYGDVEVSAESLLTFAKSLIDELEQDYKPHAELVFEDMRTPDGYPSPDFVELVDALSTHQKMRVETTTLISRHADGVLAFANAAETIGKNYGEADAYAEASTKFVEKLMVDAPAARDDGTQPPGTTTTPTGTTTTTTTPGTTTAPGTQSTGPTNFL